MQKWLLPLMAFFLLAPNFFNIDINSQYEKRNAEFYNPSLHRLNDIDKLGAFTDSVSRSLHIESNSLEYILLLEKTVAERFYHGFSRYTLKNNWLAAMGENTFGYGLACIVDANEILKHPNAACSQQAIVMMELLKRKQIDYRKIGFPHHYALEARIQNQWYYIDANKEPTIPMYNRLHQVWEGKSDKIKPFYDKVAHPDMDYTLGTGQLASVGPANDVPAVRLKMFHSFTFLFSRFAWMFPLILFGYKIRTGKKASANNADSESPAIISLHPSFSA